MSNPTEGGPSDVQDHLGRSDRDGDRVRDVGIRSMGEDVLEGSGQVVRPVDPGITAALDAVAKARIDAEWDWAEAEMLEQVSLIPELRKVR